MKGIKIFLKKKKNKNCQYGREQYRNLPEDEYQKLVLYRKKVILKWKNKNWLILLLTITNRCIKYLFLFLIHTLVPKI